MELVLRDFLKRFPDAKDEPGLERVLSRKASLDQVAAILEALLIQPIYTLALGGALRSCGSLLRLLSFLVEKRLASGNPAVDGSFVAMLVTVLELAPQCSSVVQRYLESTAPPQQLAGHSGAISPGPADPDLVFTALRALQLLPGLRQHPSWAAGPFLKLLRHRSPQVRWAAVQAVALLLNMSDASRSTLSDQLLTAAEQVAALESWQARRNAVALEQAAMWLHVPSSCEHCRDAVTHNGVQEANGAHEDGASGSSAGNIWAAGDIATSVAVDPFGLPIARGFVEVCGIELPCRDANEAASTAAIEVISPGPWPPTDAAAGAAAKGTIGGHCFVATETVRRNLEAAALVLCQGLPLLLEGPPGAGKTRMVEELAARTGNGSSMVRVHLDDQMDAKSLLGAYVCTAVPGEFAWQPGPLTQAVAEGRWVLVEDINMAPGDVLAALVPLLESRLLHVPSRGMVIPAAPGFQIIATVTSAPTTSNGGAGMSHGAYGMSNMVKELLGGLWRTVLVDAPTDAEQMALLGTAYPQLLPLLPAAVATLCFVQAVGGHDGGLVERCGNSSAQPAPSFQLTASGPEAAVTMCDREKVAAGSDASQRRRGAWHAMAAAALDAAGLKRGALALHLGRHFSVRDVFKWCRRMTHLHDPELRSRRYNQLLRTVRKASEASLQSTAVANQPSDELTAIDPRVREAAFMEAADCFAALVARPEARIRLLKGLAALWCIPEGAVEQWEQLAKPQLSVMEGPSEPQLQIGRVVLPIAGDNRQQQDIAAAASQGAGAGGTFARTGHAMRVMERISAALSCNEPVLLVGETGTGKTTMLSRMAALVGARLVSFNLSQQTDSSDLLGGFKPVEPRDALVPLLPTFMSLVRRTWARGNNDEYLTRVARLAERRKWSQLLAAFRGALTKLHDAGLVEVAADGTGGDSNNATMKLAATAADDAAEAAAEKGGKPAKKRRVGGSQQPISEVLLHEWRVFSADMAAAERAAAVAEGGFAFAFVEGVLVKALRNGWWLLLDEINLAPAEVLERLAGLLETAGGDSSAPGAVAGSVTLLERGDTLAVPRHPNFRLVAAMNPATDAGKHELPAALRNRFTEMWVPEPAAREDLAALVAAYLAGVGAAPPVEAVVDFYLTAKLEADSRLVDGAGQKPAYNLRTLARALDYTRTAAQSYGVQRALYDGAAMAFLTQLAPAAAPRMEALIAKHLLPGVKSIKALLRSPPEPSAGTHVLFEAFWLERGPLDLPAGGREEDGSGRRFVMTASVRQHLTNLARAVLIRKHPILLQGPTSAGKTSLVAYLAAQTGHTFLRINNHEHTDLQEYLGSYVSDAAGRLVFREGPLVQAVRRGWWVVLDELNLAPTEVLEALNRLLDDNRELLVPELGEVVRPHPHFMLFATQNPPGGAYAGRKVLSRAFRSRFLELHIDDIPDSELAEILEKRCAIAPSYAAKLVAVQRELQRRRNAASVFAGKHGFITPRDLFRWAERGAVGYEALAADGALLLGERLRTPGERAEVVGILEKVMNVKVDLEAVFSSEGDAPIRALQAALQEQQQEQDAMATDAVGADTVCAKAALQTALKGVVWTRSMRRMYTLVERCLRHSEPVLLVGETGTGKTTVCQLLAVMRRQHLHILNCNQHTETSDFLGGFRPTRGRERAVGHLRAAALRVAASPLLVALGITAPLVPEELGPQAIAPLAAAVMQTAEATSKALAELTARGRKDARKALRVALKKAAASGSGSGVADLDEQLKVLQADAATAAAASTEARAPFAWADGPLVTAMRRGDMILVDEINLAEDAVLERLNSVLEPGRTLTLAERGGEGAEVVVAAPGFRLLATMNPGGDFGKKELSPALSNRFTTIWVPAMDNPEEMRAILEERLADSFNRNAIAERLLRFWQEYLRLQPSGARQLLSVRDLLAWVGFVNATSPNLGALPAYAHGAYLTLLDGIGLGVGLPAAAAANLRGSLSTFLAAQLPPELAAHAALAEGQLHTAANMAAKGFMPGAPPDGQWGIPPFFVPLARLDKAAGDGAGGFALRAPTTARNAFRLLRAMQLRKAVLLEGSPGVGKTSLVAALAKAVGQTLVRINLSEQTDMMDLLGADLPAPGGAPGQFAWCDGPLLGALRAGHWVLLDELNLAGQSVLEGLNALLDHRSEVFIPELGASFHCAPGFRLFAAQNPLGEGGGRKGLPRSFLNRFTRVSVELLRRDDLLFIASTLHPRVPPRLLRRMVDLLDAMQAAASGSGDSGRDGGSAAITVAGVRDFAAAGGPWEFNLRDLLRWCELVEGSVHAPLPQQADRLSAADDMDTDAKGEAGSRGTIHRDMEVEAAASDAAAQHFAQMLFNHRLRTTEDRAKLLRLFATVWGSLPVGWNQQPPVLLSPETVVVGRATVSRFADHGGSAISTVAAAAAAATSQSTSAASTELQLLPRSLPLLESLLQALSNGWMALLVGGPSSGKTALARSAATLCGRRLLEISLTSGTDTSDLLGSFEQLEPERRLQEASEQVQQLVQSLSQQLLTISFHHGGVTGDVDASKLAAAQELQAAWSTHTTTIAALERQADAPSPILAGAARVDGLRSVMGVCRVAISLLEGATGGASAATAASAAEVTLDNLAALLADEAATAVGGRFEWVDGALTRAIERGGWVLLEGANLCNPTVLDRLNPLLEPNGVLYLNECGHTADGPRVIHPHPEFRLILALDPRHGEVSRAMRNRGIEIFLLPAPVAPAPAAPGPDTAVVNADVEAVLRSQGVAGKRLLRALARGHLAMCRLFARSHKWQPGLREAATAASLAAALLARGWPLAAAVRTGWTHVYLRGQILSVAETAEAEGILDAVERQGVSAASPRLQPPVAPDGEGEMEWEGELPGPVAASQPKDKNKGTEAEILLSLVQADGSLFGKRVLRALDAQPLLPQQLEASMLAAPAAWPVAATVQQLAGASALAGARRDVSLLRYIIGACAAAVACGFGDKVSIDKRQTMWTVRLQAALCNASGATRDAAMRLLQYMPPEVVAPVLHGGARGADYTEEVALAPPGACNRAINLHLQQLAWAAAQCLAQRACRLDGNYRVLLCDLAASEQGSLAAVLAPHAAAAGSESPLAEDLAALVSELMRSLTSHPLSEQLRQRTRTAAAAGGMPAELEQLQPLDLRYSQLLQPFLPGVPSAEWAALRCIAARLRCTQVALGARLLLHHVASGACTAVASAAASPLQLSYWRFLRPEERAATEAYHPVVDCLYPLFSTLCDLEDHLLAQPAGASIAAWEQDLEPRVRDLQAWRGALWRVSHGVLHLPLTVQSYTDGSEVEGTAAVVVEPLLRIDAPQFTWTWMQTDKALGALLALPGVGMSLASDSAHGDVTGRLEYVRAQVREALGLAVRPAKPLAWRLCGKPLLPSTLTLLEALVRGRALAAAAAAVALDVQGWPAGLQAAGVDLDAVIAAAAAAGTPATNSNSAAPQSVEDLLGDETLDVRQQVAEAIALTLCVDPGLRRALSQGVAMLGAMPLMEALYPGRTQRRRDAGGPAIGAPESLAAQGAGIVSALQDSLQARVREAVEQVLACPSEDEWMMRHGAPGVRSQASSAGSAIEDTRLPQQLLLLPSSWMASRTCRQLQLSLLAMQDCCSLRRQVKLLAAAAQAAARWPTDTNGAAAATAAAPVLARQAHAVVGAFVGSSSRCAADMSPCQQLEWVLDELEQHHVQERQQQQQAAKILTLDHSHGNAALPLGGSSGIVNDDGPDMQMLCQVVVPALAHDMWKTWHAANWRNCFSSGLGVAPSRAMHVLQVARLPTGAAAVLDGPLLSACALRVLRISESQVQNKVMRLQQLRAAAATLLLQGGGTTAAAPRQHTTVLGSPGTVATMRLASPEWAGLGYLLCQLLLAHVSSLPSEDLREQLRGLCGQLAAAAAAAAAPAPGAAIPDLVTLQDQLSFVLERSNHVLLRGLLQSLVLPAAGAVAEGLQLHLTCAGASSSSTIACNSSNIAALAQGVLYSAAQRRVARDNELALRGRAWMLVGLLRLQLVVPPAGIDPAGKYALKRRHLEGHIIHDLQPEILVRKTLQDLPGGPSEVAHLDELMQRRAEAVSQAETTAGRCVPRPQPSSYASLQLDAASFAASLAAPPRVLALMAAMSKAAATGSTEQQQSKAEDPPAAALREAELWHANAKAWCDRFGHQYAWYPDLVQPIQLAVHEMLRGFALLSAAVPTPAAAVGALGALVPHQQLGPVGAVVAGLLRFPTTTTDSTYAPGAQPLVLHPRFLAESNTLQLVQQVARAAALQAAAATPQHHQADPAKAAQGADLAGYEMQLRATRVALHALAQEALARGHTSATDATNNKTQDELILSSLERLLEALVQQWAALKAYEEAAAEEEAQQFKTKTSTATFMNEDEEAEATYRLAFPDHYAPFHDVAPLDPDEERQQEEEAATRGEEASAAAATAAQARSSAARQLLDGDLLTDVVQLHAAVYGALAAAQQRSSLVVAGEDCGTTPPASYIRTGPLATFASRASAGDAVAVERVFVRSYELGSELMAAVGYQLDSEIDNATELGHLFRLCLEHNALNRAAAATAAEAAVTSEGSRPATKRGAVAGAFTASRRRGGVIFCDEDGGVDIQKPCVEEISLLQEPVSAMESRLRRLLEEYPDHPLLVQLRAIALRVLSMPLQSPLKTALTGLELLLSRAQLWEETAASFVSLKAQLGPLAALATRWRRLELNSWKGLLRRVAARHASGAHRSWFHLHRLLSPTAFHPAGADTADTDASSAAAAAIATSGVPILIGMASVPAVLDPAAAAAPLNASTAPAAVGPLALPPELEASYRQAASTLESFVQTSTQGEFRARLTMLHAFACHVDVRRRQPGGAGPLAAALSAALYNLVRYYGQFISAVEAALAEGMAPLEKDLQDFVQLARWDDRGYYAMRASTEKAQRYLHRLSRRAEDVLRQPAATALAAAVKGMGVCELAAAAAAATRESDDVDTVATSVKENSKGDGTVQKQPHQPMASKAKLTKRTSTQIEAEAEAMELAGTSWPASADSWGGVSTIMMQWTRASTDLQAALPQDLESQQALASAAAVLGGSGDGAASYLSRLPQLLARLASVVADSLQTHDGDGTAAALVADGSTEDALDTMTPDELATAAIVRSHELRADISKGARMRKRQALAKLFEALEQQGLSRSQTSIPPYDRDVAAWFKHPEPMVEPLWQVHGGPEVDATAASTSWSRADDYYYRSMARLQKLWQGTRQPHRDLSMQEVSTARRLSEHVLYIVRRQRNALGEATSAVVALTKLSDWMSEAAASPSVSPAASSCALAADGAPVAESWSQAERLVAIRQQKNRLDELVLLGSETCQVLDACVSTRALPAAQAQLAMAASAARIATATMTTCKRRLDAALQGCIAWVTDLTGACSNGNGENCLVWVNRASILKVLQNCQELVSTEAELARTVRAVAATSSSNAGSGLQEVPGLYELHRAVASAAAEASECLASASRRVQPGPAAGATATASAMAGITAGLSAEFVAAVEGLVRGVLLWAQPAQQQQAGADGGRTQPARSMVQATNQLEAALKLPRAKELACACTAVLRQLPVAAQLTSSVAAAPGLLLRSVAPMLRMAAVALRLRALQLLALHRSTAKLAYICTAVLATLVEEGYCMPEAGKEVDGGDAPGEFKEAEGTGLGDGTGAKDISDQLENQDQLLGAQQRGAQPQEEQQDKQSGGPEEDQKKGIEMDDDFDGALHDVPTDERDLNRDSDDEEGDDERIDQQMGDVGDNEEVVDERLWNEEDGQDGKQDEQKNKKEEKYEKDAPIQVEDKTDLEYAAGQQEEQQDGPAKEPPKKEQKKKDQGAEEAQPEAGDEEDIGDEGLINEDTDDKYEDRHHAAPQAAEEELELPEEMNLDCDGADNEDVQEQPQHGPEQEEATGGEDEQGKEGDEHMASGEDNEQQGLEEAGGEDGKDGGGDEAGGDADEADNVDMEDAPAGMGKADEQQSTPPPESEQPPEPMAVDQAREDEGEGKEPRDSQVDQQQAGPCGVASGAPTKQPEIVGAAHGAPEEQQPVQPSDGDAASQRPQTAAADAQPPDTDRPPDAAPDARQADAGMASAAHLGAPAPISGGDREPGSQQQQQQKRRAPRQLQDPNPLRNLGDALERWRANLVVQHEATPANEADAAGAADDEKLEEGNEQPPAGAEFQFLGAEERSRQGDTQALAPATDEQAMEQAEQREESTLMQQPRDEQQDGKENAGEDDAVAMEEDHEEAGGEDGATQDQNQAAVVSGPVPRTWGGKQRQAKLATENPDGSLEDKVEREERPSADELLGREAQEGDAATDGEDLESSRVVARLANATLEDGDRTAAASTAEGLPVLQRGLTTEQMDVLRHQLDERLRNAAGAAAVVDLAYGSEIWARCDTLVSGLAGELTEQLRLILEPTLASKLAGDYRTGKRINMKKVIGYIASHFRRDKIWLRRNRPDKRRYQVLLACDDSRSMAENGCGGFALEALALICKAMSRLEVGQVGVLKFGGGEGVVPLHPLDAPFNDNVGPSLAARLTFRQDNTIADRPMLQLMASLDHMLATARHSCGAGGIGAGTQDLAQLVLILADGRFHEKESLHAAVREAAAKRGVCLAFIVLDNPTNSLLDMQSVSFAAGKPVFTKYLDSFPFPYYIVLRDIASLPATLADLLRQWFELSTA